MKKSSSSSSSFSSSMLAVVLLATGCSMFPPSSRGTPVFFPLNEFTGAPRTDKFTLTADGSLNPQTDGTNIYGGFSRSYSAINGTNTVELVPGGYTLTMPGWQRNLHFNVNAGTDVVSVVQLITNGLPTYVGTIFGTNGLNATITISNTITGSAGSQAIVTNLGTAQAAVLQFTIPQGANGTNGINGTNGATGATGPAGPAGADGINGTNGVNGVNGTNGLSASISITNTITGAAGSAASVTNIGNSQSVVLRFTIPQGSNGVASIVTSNSATVTFTGNGTSTNPLSSTVTSAMVTNNDPRNLSFYGTNFIGRVVNEGSGNSIEEDLSHAEGLDNTVISDKSHAEGANNNISGTLSHAEGEFNYVSGPYSHAEGMNHTATGSANHVEGTHNQTSGDSAHAEGTDNIVTGDYAHAENDKNFISAYAGHVGGFNSTNTGQTSWAHGYQTLVTGNDSHGEGFHARATNDNTFVWTDGTEFGSTTNKQVSFHADNGFRLLGGPLTCVAMATNTPLQVYGHVTNGICTWTTTP